MEEMDGSCSPERKIVEEVDLQLGVRGGGVGGVHGEEDDRSRWRWRWRWRRWRRGGPEAAAAAA